MRGVSSEISTAPLSFFFFQAEDGIRDHCVTGVQTCALPICWSLVVPSWSPRRTTNDERRTTNHMQLSLEAVAAVRTRIARAQQLAALRFRDAFAAGALPPIAHLRRSEERRVGKAGRARWSPS